MKKLKNNERYIFFIKTENIKVIKAPAKGISDAFNKGVEVAKGDYFYFIGKCLLSCQ